MEGSFVFSVSWYSSFFAPCSKVLRDKCYSSLVPPELYWITGGLLMLTRPGTESEQSGVGPRVDREKS